MLPQETAICKVYTISNASEKKRRGYKRHGEENKRAPARERKVGEQEGIHIRKTRIEIQEKEIRNNKYKHHHHFVIPTDKYLSHNLKKNQTNVVYVFVRLKESTNISIYKATRMIGG